MEKLHLMNGPYLTNAAMLLFSKDPDDYFTPRDPGLSFAQTH